jgi:hypothetical protein
MRVRLSVLGALALLVATLSTSPARAQDLPACAVAPFEGSAGPVLRRSFARALEESGFVRVIPEDQVDGGAPDAIARTVGADLVITGEVSGSRRARRVDLVAYDANGREIGRETVRVRPGGAGRRAVDRGVNDLLADALPQLGSRSGGDAGAAPVHTTPAEVEEEEEAVGDEPAEPSAPSTGRGEFGANPLLFVVRLGVSIRTRDAEAVLSSGMPRSWRSNPVYAELHAGFELRPLAQQNDLSRGLFIRGEFANAVGLGTLSPSGQAVDTHFWRVGGDLGYLLPVGPAVEVGLAFGAGYDAYDLGANTEFPSVDLIYLRPALRGRLRLVDEVVVVGLESGLRVAIDRGPISAAFGGGDTIGFDVGASVSGALDFGLAYSVDMTWVGYWHSFSGGGTLATGQDGTEHGFRVLVSAGYAFR